MKPIATLDEARRLFESHRAMHEARGVILPGVRAYLPDAFRNNSALAMDGLAQLYELIAMDAGPGLYNYISQNTLSTEPNSALPALLTTYIDPEVYEILFAPNKAAIIFGERKEGDWLRETAMFPVVEHVGEVSSYADYSESGHTGANTNWPQYQSYLFQTIEEYGEHETERASLAKINWVSEINRASATVINKFFNFSYFFGVNGLQNYGLLTDPNLTAALTPATKGWGGKTWYNGTLVAATANEIFNDVQSVIIQIINQTAGLVNRESKFVIGMSPQSEAAFTQTNSFNVNVSDLLKKNFPNLRVESAVQYGALTTSNPQGVAAGNQIQIIVEMVEGQKTGYCAFNERMRAHPIIRYMSSFRQKKSAGTWGAIIRMPVAIASMIGI